jgi:peptidoglycan hydrolase-like protein with peptidoglycan-binding domain
MIKARNIATMLALCSVAALPACSMFGGGDNRQASRTSYPSQSYASAQPGYAMPQAPELTPDMTQQVQERLQQQGMYRGRIDGVWGPGTEAAMRSYQQQHNLNPTGKLDADTVAALNLGTSQNSSNAQQGQRYGSNYNPPPANNNPSANNNMNQPNSSTTR